MMRRITCAALAPLLACSHPATPDAALTDAAAIDGAPARPNIIFVLTDDLDDEVYGHMPRLAQLMDDQGTRFTNHFLNISLCCPSRTAILRGQYAHNTHIFSNAPPTGGFETFYANGSEADTLPVWMSQAGYRTALFGKYLNGYPNTAPPAYVPPGWTEWYSPVDGTPYSEYNYQLNENGTIVPYAAAPEDYMVDVLSTKADDFIQRASADHAPFFMYIAPYVPHSPATPAPRYANDFPLAAAPRTPSFNEADVSDKPAWLAAAPVLTKKQIADIDALYQRRLQSMEAMQDLVQNLVDTLTATGHLDDTYIVFTSDNGFHQGQHRLPSGKNTEFDEDLFVPLIVRGPGVPAGRVLEHATMNVDFTPTFLDLAGAAIPVGVDGRSFAPLLGTNPPPITAWRQSVFLEHAAEVADDEQASRPQAPAGTLEPPDQLFTAAPLAAAGAPPFEGVRTAAYTYVEYATGERELYDHARDPDQLVNIAATADPALLAQLAAIVHGLHGCQGDACRAAEAMPAP